MSKITKAPILLFPIFRENIYLFPKYIQRLNSIIIKD